MSYVVDYHNNLIHIAEPQTAVDIQELYDFLMDEMSRLPGMNYSDICIAEGKTELSETTAVGITLILLSPWQLRFWDGQYRAIIAGGNLVGGLDDNPVAYTPNVQILILQSAAATIVQTGGSALTQDEHDKLITGLDISIPTETWNKQRDEHDEDGSFGKTDEWAGGGGSFIDSVKGSPFDPTGNNT